MMQGMQEMMQMQMMGKMMEGMSGGGGESNGESGGGGFNMMDMWKMMNGGADTRVVPVWRDARAFGTILRSGVEEFGQIGLRILPPTLASPRASLELVCAGQRIEILPQELELLKAWLNEYPQKSDLVGVMPNGEEVTGTVQDVLKATHGLDDQVQNEAALTQMTGMG